jgi:hypothetical protein
MRFFPRPLCGLERFSRTYSSRQKGSEMTDEACHPSGKTRIFFVVFHTTARDSVISPCGSVGATPRRALKLDDWPYDSGDDPSFYAARKFGGKLSWGVCRQDVRNRLCPGDVVVFFSSSKQEDTGRTNYRLCALATAERRVSQDDIWQDESLAIYREYSNLLIRPLGDAGWEHFEPDLGGQGGHHDWLWRIACHRGLQRGDFKRLQATDKLEFGATVRRAVGWSLPRITYYSPPARPRRTSSGSPQR